MNQDPMDLFIENLLTQANMSLPDGFKDQFVEKLKEQLNRRLAITLMEDLDDASLAEFNQLMAAEPAPDFTAIQHFYVAKIPNFEQKMQTALAEFAQDFVNVSKK